MPPAVDPAVLDPAVRVLLRSKGRDRDEPRPYAADRPAVSGNALLRRAADDGVQQMTRPLHNEGHAVNVTRSRRLMRLMRLMPIRRKPAASRPAPGRKTYPYPLGGRVEQPDQVGCAGIADLPMRRGCLCPVAVMDRFPRKLLAWRISNTPAADFCVAARNEAAHHCGPPEIMNADRASQFTSCAWVDRLKRAGTRISMDGRGAVSTPSSSSASGDP